MEIWQQYLLAKVPKGSLTSSGMQDAHRQNGFALLLPCDGTMTQPMYTGADAGTLHGMLWRNGHTGMREPRVPSHKQLLLRLTGLERGELGDIT